MSVPLFLGPSNSLKRDALSLLFYNSLLNLGLDNPTKNYCVKFHEGELLLSDFINGIGRGSEDTPSNTV